MRLESKQVRCFLHIKAMSPLERYSVYYLTAVRQCCLDTGRQERHNVTFCDDQFETWISRSQVF